MDFRPGIPSDNENVVHHHLVLRILCIYSLDLHSILCMRREREIRVWAKSSHTLDVIQLSRNELRWAILRSARSMVRPNHHMPRSLAGL